MKKIFVLLFFKVVFLNSNINAIDYYDFLTPIPENPSLVGYSTELKESMLSIIEEGNNLHGFFGGDFRINSDPFNGFLGIGLGFPIKFTYCSLFIPLFFGTVFDFTETDVKKLYLVQDAVRHLPPQGLFFSAGLFISSRYFHLGFMYDWFKVDDDNRFLGGTYSGAKIFPRFYFNEIPYVGKIFNALDAFFSVEQFIESFSREITLNTFNTEYNANLIFNQIPIGVAVITLTTYTHMKWYDMYSKADMQGIKLYLGFKIKNNNSFTLFSDIAYRRYFDVLLAPEYSNYYDGLYIKTGFIIINDYYSPYYFQMYVESGKEPLFKTSKIGLLFGINYSDFLSWKLSGNYTFSSDAEIPIDGATSIKYFW